MKLHLQITDKEHFHKVCKFAAQTGQMPQLREQLARLGSGTWFCSEATCVLYRDFAPYSFEFSLKSRTTNEIFMYGGLIYHGPHDNGGDGSAPTFSVNITPFNGWSIHT